MTDIDTDLDWQPWARRLAEQMERDGVVSDRRWRAAIEMVPRHVLVPSFYTDSGAHLVRGSDLQQQHAWLEAVYSDDTLVTQMRTAVIPDEYGGGEHTRSTSSSTKPSVMLRMLTELEVRDGNQVLEIGTGTGYTAALLCARLGDNQIASVDLHPDLITDARQRLAELGYHPTLATGDGAAGLPEAAPFDRIIATCAVSAIPPAWIEQLRPGGILLTDLRGDIAGALIKLHKTDDHTAQGRFLDYPAPFMWLREHPDNPLRDREPPYLLRDACDTHYTTTPVDPNLFTNPYFDFLTQLHLPGIRRFPPSDGTYLLFAEENLWAEAHTSPHADGTYHVTYSGDHNLWHTVEHAHQIWEQAGHPAWDRFGLTATPERQHVWLDDPSGPSWELPS